MGQFDPQQSARRQKYVTVGSGTTQAVLTHESVDAEYIALWLYARAEEAASGPHPDVERFKRYREMASIVCPQLGQSAEVKTAPLRSTVTWDEDENYAASLQGWGVYHDPDCGWRVEPNKTMGDRFQTPLLAGAWVRERAARGDKLAQKAIEFLKQENGGE